MRFESMMFVCETLGKISGGTAESERQNCRCSLGARAGQEWTGGYAIGGANLASTGELRSRKRSRSDRLKERYMVGNGSSVASQLTKSWGGERSLI